MNMYREADFACISEAEAIILPIAMADVESDLSRIFSRSGPRPVRAASPATQSTPFSSVRAAVPISVAVVLGATALGFAIYPHDQPPPRPTFHQTVKPRDAVKIAEVPNAPILSQEEAVPETVAAIPARPKAKPSVSRKERRPEMVAAKTPVKAIAPPKPTETKRPLLQADGLPIGTSGKAIRLKGEALRLAFEADAKLTREANNARAQAAKAATSEH